MAKTNPIGVRFDEDLLNEFKEQKLADTPQGVLSLLENYYKTAKQFNSEPIKKLTSILEVDNERIKKEQEKPPEPEIDQSEILKQIEALKKETIPKERDTRLGRPVWQREQWQKIEKLEKKLKPKNI